MAVCGYLDKWSYMSGEEVLVYVDTDRESYFLDLTSLDNPRNPLAGILRLGPLPGKRQHSQVGSMIYSPSNGAEALTNLSIELWAWPTLPQRGVQQVLLSWVDSVTAEGVRLALDGEGRPSLEVLVAGGRWNATTKLAVRAKTWCHISAGVDTVGGRCAVVVVGQDGQLLDRAEHAYGAPDQTRSLHLDGPITIGASGVGNERGHFSIDGSYDGKIESPVVRREWSFSELEDVSQTSDASEAAIVGRWDFEQITAPTRVPDSGPGGRHGLTVNLPATRMKGHAWSWRQSPDQQARNRNAIHFHHDDVGNKDWDVSVTLQLPEDTESGAFAIQLDDGSAKTELPFLVRSREQASRPNIAVLLPTFTYLAYANLRPDLTNSDTSAIHKAHLEVGLQDFDGSNPVDVFLADRPDLGAAVYNRHADGSGICHSTRLRPVLTFSSEYRWWGTGGPRHFSADVLLLRWLRAEGQSFDVITDEEVDAQGADLLARYRVVLTGSHPEYVSANWLAALEDWLDSGGQLMYLGGNGLYWVTATNPDVPGTIEVRRGWAGSRDWESEAGEEWLAFDDGVGGLWRHRGAAPQRFLGVGFSAMGWGSSAGYARCEESFANDVAFVFEGIGDAEIIGGFDSGLGPALTGAAGDEIDRADSALGTPFGTKLLATSSGRHGLFQRAIEDVLQLNHYVGSEHDPDVRADMVLIERPNGARVFSVGSMNWIPFLGAGESDNNVAQVTRNVLRDFLSRPEDSTV